MKSVIALAILCLFLTSCQKEISFEDPNVTPGTGGGTNSGTTTATKLVRVGVRGGSDSITLNYTYNSNARVIEYSLAGTGGGQAVDESVSYTRNSFNIITQEIYKSSSLAQYGLTQIVTDHVYDDVANRYKYSLTKITVATFSFKDSLAYAYDGSGRVTLITDYLDEGAGYSAVAKEEYTYSGNNVASVKASSFDDQAGAWVVDETESYEYDTKTNPLFFPTDAIPLRTIANLASFSSPNNYTKRTTVTTNPAATTVVSRTYTYTNANRPATAVSTSGSGTQNSTYYYQ